MEYLDLCDANSDDSLVYDDIHSFTYYMEGIHQTPYHYRTNSRYNLSRPETDRNRSGQLSPSSTSSSTSSTSPTHQTPYAKVKKRKKKKSIQSEQLGSPHVTGSLHETGSSKETGSRVTSPVAGTEATEVHEKPSEGAHKPRSIKKRRRHSLETRPGSMHKQSSMEDRRGRYVGTEPEPAAPPEAPRDITKDSLTCSWCLAMFAVSVWVCLCWSHVSLYVSSGDSSIFSTSSLKSHAINSRTLTYIVHELFDPGR